VRASSRAVIQTFRSTLDHPFVSLSASNGYTSVAISTKVTAGRRLDTVVFN
jgi:hypothetical protein